ncbi:Nramp family divalent metal transporter [Reyranella sp.]|uniref:Nramp family divalent metal transporter n=1 Tax=Reyranella sp. TaxID=1929291 RepID=UPI003D1392E1
MVAVPAGAFWRKFLAFSGPGYLVAVGYMDPGNWATGIAGGAGYGYHLLSVILVANLAAMFLQSLAAKLGIVSGLDLAQACRRAWGPRVSFVLWILCEIAIIACDLAELLGAAIALKLLFGLPLVWGVALIGFEVLLLLGLTRHSVRPLEAFIVCLMLVISACFAVELALARPAVGAVLRGFVPSPEIVSDPAMLYIAIGILGATIMPHNLYLHSALVKSRAYERTVQGIRQAIRYSRIDVVVALTLAIFVNGAILILAASAFHGRGMDEVSIEDAYQLLAPALGTGAASTLFAVALLASGQNSSITGTLAGQIVLEGFTDLRIAPWMRQLASRLLAMVPAILAVSIWGESSVTDLLIFSQVVLSLQLPFAVYPLVRLTGNRAWMGRFTNGRLTAVVAWTLTAGLIGLNAYLLISLTR